MANCVHEKKNYRVSQKRLQFLKIENIPGRLLWETLYLRITKSTRRFLNFSAVSLKNSVYTWETIKRNWRTCKKYIRSNMLKWCNALVTGYIIIIHINCTEDNTFINLTDSALFHTPWSLCLEWYLSKQNKIGHIEYHKG